MSKETHNPPPGHQANPTSGNARMSTGSPAQEANNTTSLAGFRHPITAQVLCLTEDDSKYYLAFTGRMFREFAPVTMHEEQLAQRIADCAWRMNRMRAMETHILTLGFNARQDKIITDHPQIHGALATADGLSGNLQDLAAISIHEQRICRQHAQALKQLDEAQTKRKAQEQHALDQAGNLYELHKEDHPEPDAPAYHPEEDGFVFTVPQIDAHLRRQVRVHRSLGCENVRFQTAGPEKSA